MSSTNISDDGRTVLVTGATSGLGEEAAGQPVDEQPRYLPGLEDTSRSTLADLFEQFTGSSPLTPL
jgi:hypothetical protein